MIEGIVSAEPAAFLIRRWPGVFTFCRTGLGCYLQGLPSFMLGLDLDQ